MHSILIVDDDGDARDVLAKYFAKAGYSVMSEANGRAALKALLSSTPDVIILDARMPEMDGIQLLGVMRSYLRLVKMPVILLTAYPESADIDRAKQLGVNCVFAKTNYQLADLAACVRSLIANPQAQCGQGTRPGLSLLNPPRVWFLSLI